MFNHFLSFDERINRASYVIYNFCKIIFQAADSKSRISKIFIGIVLAACFTLASCSKDEGGNSDDNDQTGPGTTIIFESSSFADSVVMTYTDGSEKKGAFKNGTAKIPLSTNGNKTIASIQPENGDIILIGRKEGAEIKLHYNKGNLNHRAAISGLIPIGTYAEIQLINKYEATLSASYKLEYDLDLMILDWIPIGEKLISMHNDAGFFLGYKGSFKGNFDGNNHEIHNLKVEERGAAGLFGVVETKSDNRYIKNIVIKSGHVHGRVDGTNDAGGIVANLIQSYVTNEEMFMVTGHTISNCINYAAVEGGFNGTGGIVGR